MPRARPTPGVLHLWYHRQLRRRGHHQQQHRRHQQWTQQFGQWPVHQQPNILSQPGGQRADVGGQEEDGARESRTLQDEDGLEERG